MKTHWAKHVASPSNQIEVYTNYRPMKYLFWYFMSLLFNTPDLIDMVPTHALLPEHGKSAKVFFI